MNRLWVRVAAPIAIGVLALALWQAGVWLTGVPKYILHRRRAMSPSKAC